MNRTATCHCGQLSVVTTGEPIRVVACHCSDCQRRTGSSFNLGAVYQTSEVEPLGETTSYSRTGEMGTNIEFRFCPTCGSNVYWYFGDVVVVAVGCFADPSFPAPTVSLYGKNRSHWLPHFDVPLAYAGNRESEQENAD